MECCRYPQRLLDPADYRNGFGGMHYTSVCSPLSGKY
jgi:hypothetical protein